MKKCFSPYFHLDFQMDIPPFSFIVENKPHDVPCVFQIWNRKDVPRIIPEKLLPRGFSFVKIENNPDISFRRVGVYAGKIDRNYHSKSTQSHYFIKFSFPLFKIFILIYTASHTFGFFPGFFSHHCEPQEHFAS